jgi:CRISPR-associated protein Csb1
MQHPQSGQAEALTSEVLGKWATDSNGPVALHLKQRLLPVEVGGRVVFPPTFADIGYNVDELSDGTKVATIDSVGSQANRIEPGFEGLTYEGDKGELPLVPRIEIKLYSEGEGNERHDEKRSILGLAHRVADAVIQATPELLTKVTDALIELRRTGNATPLCAIAPTSLVFGFWASRGQKGATGEKRPRLVRATIRAWDVEILHAAAQFTSISKALRESQREELRKEAKKKDLSKYGLDDSPAIFRKVGNKAAKEIPEFRAGQPNPDRRVLGGVVVNGHIERDVTVNLVALRGLRGANEDESNALRQYLLGLSLLAATTEIDLFLREGCHLRYADMEDAWHEVPRRGEPKPIDLSSEAAETAIRTFVQDAAAEFFEIAKPHMLEKHEFDFDLEAAKRLLAGQVPEDGADG